MSAISLGGRTVDDYVKIGVDKPPVKILDVVIKPSVVCPFTKLYTTLDRCRQCNNYGGFTDKGMKIKCKWPY
jgi:hypothetical protein